MLYGTDNSDHQPSHFPLTDGHTRSSNFAFIKATQGTGYVNPKLAGQVNWARTNHLRVGLYHFLEVGNVAAQIKHFRDTCTKLDVYQKGDIVAVDWESYVVGRTTKNVSESDKNDAIDAATKAFPFSRVGLYCNKDYWINHDHSSKCGDFLWIAAPDDPDGHPSIKHAWTFHQTGTFNNQDQDVAQFESRAQLDAWANGKVPQVTVPTAFHDVIQFDGIPAPVGHIDPDGNYSAGTYLKKIFEVAEKALISADAALATALECKALIQKIGTK